MASQCPKCHQIVDEDYICCSGVEFQWKCQSCHKRSRGFAVPFGRCPDCGGELKRVEDNPASSWDRILALQEAFQIEVSSCIFYHRIAEAVDDPQLSDFFESLSAKEQEHAEELDAKYHLHLVNKEVFKDSGRPLPEPFFDDLSFFANSGDIQKLFDCAISLEKTTLRFFLDKAEPMSPGLEKELYLELAAEEREHIVLLETERNR